MGILTRCTILTLGVLATARSGTAASDPEPKWDPATVVTIRVVVVDVKEVAKGNPLPGIHLMARSESGRGGSDTFDIYLAPADFLKDMGLVFSANDRLELSGSKVKSGGATVILTRDVRRDTSTLYIRERDGEPVWKTLVQQK
jgi:hypothetical protein